MTFLNASTGNSPCDLRSSCVLSALCQNRLQFTSPALEVSLQAWQGSKKITALLPVKRWRDQILSEVGRYQFSSQLYIKQLFKTNALSRASLISWCSSAIFLDFSPPVFSAQLVDQSNRGACSSRTAFFHGGSVGLKCSCPFLIVCTPTLLSVQLCMGLIGTLDGGDFCGGQ